MKISIITVVRNGAETIDDTINSVLGQTYPDMEYLVIDGASTDGTMAIVERHKDRIAKIVSEPDLGIYDAMNKGIGLATGDIIGLLNADDVYAHEGVLKKVAEALADPNVDACYADLVYVDQWDLRKIKRYWKSRPFLPGLFAKGWMLPHPTFFVRRRIYEQHGLFNLEYKIQSDYDLVMRFLEIDRIRTTYIPEIFVRMRVGGASNRSIMNRVKGTMESYRACRKYNLPVGPFFPLKKILSRADQFFIRPQSG